MPTVALRFSEQKAVDASSRGDQHPQQQHMKPGQAQSQAHSMGHTQAPRRPQAAAVAPAGGLHSLQRQLDQQTDRQARPAAPPPPAAPAAGAPGQAVPARCSAASRATRRIYCTLPSAPTTPARPLEAAAAVGSSCPAAAQHLMPAATIPLYQGGDFNLSYNAPNGTHPRVLLTLPKGVQLCRQAACMPPAVQHWLPALHPAQLTGMQHPQPAGAVLPSEQAL